MSKNFKGLHALILTAIMTMMLSYHMLLLYGVGKTPYIVQGNTFGSVTTGGELSVLGCIIILVCGIFMYILAMYASYKKFRCQINNTLKRSREEKIYFLTFKFYITMLILAIIATTIFFLVFSL